MEPKNSLFSSSKKLPHFSKDLDEELKNVDENLLFDKKIDSIGDYVFVLECKTHEKSLIRYICQDPTCPFDRFVCPKCCKENPSHFEQHRSQIKEYQSVLEEKYQDLLNIHEKMNGNLQTIEMKIMDSSKEKLAYKKAKIESRKTMQKFKKVIEEIKEKIKEHYHDLVTKLFESSLNNYGKFIQTTDRDLKLIEEETLFIKENLQELEKILKSHIDYVLLEKLIIEYAPYLRNNGIKDILNSLLDIELRVNSFEILEKKSENILLKEFAKLVVAKIERIIDENIVKYERNRDEKIEKRVNIKNLIRNRNKQIYKPGKFSQNKSSIGKSTTHSMKNLNWTEPKKKN